MKYSKVTNDNNLIRDEETNAILNTNIREYNSYISQKKLKEKENQKLQIFEEELSKIKEDIDEIKFLIRSLINGSK